MKRPLHFLSAKLPGVDTAELQGRLIVVEGPDAVGRTTQIALLKSWLEQKGHAVIESGMARSNLAGRGIQDAKMGNTLGPLTMTLFYATDFADRLENEIIPALRAGFVVLTDRYIYSVMARGLARGEDRHWLEKLAGFALTPHAVYYLRAPVDDLVKRVVIGRGKFDYWESGMDLHFGPDMYESFVRYQGKIIKALDSMVEEHGFTVVDASKGHKEIQRELQTHIDRLFQKPARKVSLVGTNTTTALRPKESLKFAPADKGVRTKSKRTPGTNAAPSVNLLSTKKRTGVEKQSNTAETPAKPRSPRRKAAPARVEPVSLPDSTTDE
jgi:dTMP kinase